MCYDDLINYTECIMVRDLDTHPDYIPLILYTDTFKNIVQVDEVTDTKIFLTVTGLQLTSLTSIERILIAGYKTVPTVGNTYFIQLSRDCKNTYMFVDISNGEFFTVFSYTINTIVKKDTAVNMRVSYTLPYTLVSIDKKQRSITVKLRK